LAAYYPDLPPRHFLDPADTTTNRWGGMVAPEEFNPFAWLVAESSGPGAGIDPNDPNQPDRFELMAGITGPGLRNMLNGGIEVEYGAPMRPGDVITSVRRLAGYEERDGRLGRMLLTITEDTWTNQDGAVVKTTRNTLIRYGDQS
jgi:hypothetical protein